MSPQRPPGTPLSKRHRVDLALRGGLFLLVVVVALVLAFATDLGHEIDLWQAGGPGGTYSPKLTMMILILGVSIPAVVVYFLLRFLVVSRLTEQ